MCEKQKLYEANKGQFDERHESAVNLDEMELFRTFKKYDRNMNGVLEFSEYTQCLSECEGINLTKQEIVTSALAADLNCDGTIDFEEFMKHFSDFLNMVHMNNKLQGLMDNKKANEQALKEKEQSLAHGGLAAGDEKGKANAGGSIQQV